MVFVTIVCFSYGNACSFTMDKIPFPRAQETFSKDLFPWPVHQCTDESVSGCVIDRNVFKGTSLTHR